MTSPTSEKLLTAEEFARLPEPDAGKLELVRGRVVHRMPVGEEHGEVSLNIGAAVRSFVRQHGLGGAGVETGHTVERGPDSVFAPDVYWTRRQEGSERPARGFRERGPDLAVEVKSPNDTEPEVAAKVATYLETGSERVWVVRPSERTVTVHRPDHSATVLREGDVLASDDAGFPIEGFALPVAEVFV